MTRASPGCVASMVALACSSALLLSGCNGQGEYTGQFKEQAVARLNALKSGTSYEMGLADLESGNLERAYDHASESVGLTPDAATSHLLLARVLIEMQREELAIGSLDEAIELDPMNAEPYYYRGAVYERFGEPALAIAEYYRAFSLDPVNVQYLVAAAEMHMELGQYAEATELIGDHESQFRFEPAVRQTQGHIALFEGAPDRAEILFREASLLAPEDTGILEDLARVQIRLERWADAERTLGRLLRSIDDDAVRRRDLEHLRVRCLVELDRPLEARKILSEMLRSDDGESDVEAWRQMGTVSLMMDDPRGLRRSADRLVAIAPERHEGYFLLAVWQQANEGPEAAARTLERAILPAKAAGTAEVATLLATLYAELGDFEKAARAARHAIESDPRDPLAREVDALLADR